jgi:heterodisulfide reductase subunit A-like polyferredoxin
MEEIATSETILDVGGGVCGMTAASEAAECG